MSESELLLQVMRKKNTSDCGICSSRAARFAEALWNITSELDTAVKEKQKRM